jgi:hypothetical protein
LLLEQLIPTIASCRPTFCPALPIHQLRQRPNPLSPAGQSVFSTNLHRAQPKITLSLGK